MSRTKQLGAVAAVLLDMDGTLVDSDAAVERAWTVWAREYGAEAEEVLAVAHGSPSILTVRRLLPGLAEAALAAAAQRQLDLQYDDLRDVGPLPGAHRLVELLDRSGMAWAVVTSADRRLARARLGAAGIVAPVLVTLEDVRTGKPDPEPYRVAAQRLGVEPASCLVVEDSAPGVAAGRAAGMRTAALRGLAADLSIANLGELADLLERASRP